MRREQDIGTLIRFARLASEARRETDILAALAEVLVTDVEAKAVAIFQISEQGTARFVPSPYLPAALAGLHVEADALEGELEKGWLAHCAGEYGASHARPLVAGQGLFGSVTMFFEHECPRARLDLAEALIDLTAMALEGAARLNELARSHAELRASQERLIRSEKLRALGEMAAGVSHDLKNILNPLSLHLQMAQRRLEQGRTEDATKNLVEMKQVLVRGVETIDRLRDYGRQSREARPEDMVDLAHLLREASEIARPRMTARGLPVRYNFEQQGNAQVRGRAGDIVSALVNLIVNAIDAMPTAGTITLSSGESESSAWAEVADDGPGMPPEIERRVFEPFFTTKGDAGTGLGLAMVYACMQRHGGTVKLHTALGQGTTFRLIFPKAGSSVPPPH
jgi:signal transduction histidine kinase